FANPGRLFHRPLCRSRHLVRESIPFHEPDPGAGLGEDDTRNTRSLDVNAGGQFVAADLDRRAEVAESVGARRAQFDSVILAFHGASFHMYRRIAAPSKL